jgi:predicted glycogen debranching enzyme
MTPMTLPLIELGRAELTGFEASAQREWLVTNGLGGFASGSIGGARTRRYHGLLVAALKPPLERVVLVAKLDATVHYRGDAVALGSNEYADGTVDPRGFERLERFRLEGQTPVWQYVIGDALLEQRVTMVHGESTTLVTFALVRASGPVTLALKPYCTYRDYHGQTRGADWAPRTALLSRGCEIHAFDGARPYRLEIDRGSFGSAPTWHWSFKLRAESARGLVDREDLFVPGQFSAELQVGESVTLRLALGEDAGAPAAAFAAERRRQQHLLEASGTAAEPDWVRRLVLAADQFVVRRGGSAGGRSIIAGYPWFGDWGRDTMIALPGLALATGRHDVARNVLRTFGQFVSEGMLPNRFPDAGEMPEYNTVDATLWYFHALDEYVAATGDRALVAELYPVLQGILEAHLKGTRYRIHVDADGLLYAGEPGVQLTWMDAKIGDWVVTPRIGKPVEINALWYRALVTMESFAGLQGDGLAQRRYAALAGNALRSFRRRYWSKELGYLADVVDGPGGVADYSLRPNQILAVSLDASLLEREQARAVVDTCARELWTPVGMRSLARRERGYTGRYAGGPQERDAVYHQGTVWSWLLGPFAIAHWNAYRDADAARAYLTGIAQHLREACIGQVSEIFDGDVPHRPEGCVAQAWSVAEVLRAWRTVGAAVASEAVTNAGRGEPSRPLENALCRI